LITGASAGASQSEDLIRFDDVHMVFSSGLRKPVYALRGLTLGVPRGAILGLLGANGAGKTTAIACLLGLLDPQVGAVYIAGSRVGTETRHDVRCGVLLEDTRLPPFLTVRAALATVCAIRNVAAKAREIERVAQIGQVGGLMSRTVSALSKGQARKVGLAAALIGDPALLVLDEPSAGLDTEARIEFDGLVRGLRDGRRTVIIASHMLGDVESTCTHVAVVRDGRVVLSGLSLELLEDARRGQGSDVHIDAASAAAATTLGFDHQPSRYPGLVVLKSTLTDLEVLTALARAGIVPRRVEPRVSMLTLYLEAAHGQETP
jgi:ABC-2 type transport system ATP-binding protein